MDEKLLKATGAVGVIKKGQGVQVIYGRNVTVIKANLEAYLEKRIRRQKKPKPWNRRQKLLRSLEKASRTEAP